MHGGVEARRKAQKHRGAKTLKRVCSSKSQLRFAYLQWAEKNKFLEKEIQKPFTFYLYPLS